MSADCSLQCDAEIAGALLCLNPFGINDECDDTLSALVSDIAAQTNAETGDLLSVSPMTTISESVEGWAPSSDEASPGGPAVPDQEASRRSPMAKLHKQHEVMLREGWTPQRDGSYKITTMQSEAFHVPPVD